MKQTRIVVTLILLGMIGCSDNPVEARKTNRNPVMLSLTVFPEVVGPSDSLIVVCDAIDPDGDSLVYDWYTSGVVRIKGGTPNNPALYNTSENYRVFYAPDSLHVFGSLDTFWVECAARDRIGGQDTRTVIFFVTRDSLGAP